MARNICKLFNFMQYEQCNQHLLKSISCAKWATYLSFYLYFHHGYTSELTLETACFFFLILTSWRFCVQKTQYSHCRSIWTHKLNKHFIVSGFPLLGGEFTPWSWCGLVNSSRAKHGRDGEFHKLSPKVFGFSLWQVKCLCLSWLLSLHGEGSCSDPVPISSSF